VKNKVFFLGGLGSAVDSDILGFISTRSFLWITRYTVLAGGVVFQGFTTQGCVRRARLGTVPCYKNIYIYIYINEAITCIILFCDVGAKLSMRNFVMQDY
jgi:hypothetical protein